MGLFKALPSPSSPEKNPLITFYQSLLKLKDSPFTIALGNLEYLEGQCDQDNADELLLCLLEDSAYASLQSTCYEEMLMALANHPEMVEELIEQFHQSREERDRILLKQTHSHVGYIVRGGHCPGCDQCENHKDVDELIPHYEKKDLTFLLELYLGMQTVHLGLEELIFYFLQENPTYVKHITRERILEYRSYIYRNSQSKLQKALASR